MRYIVRRAASQGARELAEAIGAQRLRGLDRTPLREGDVVISWGEGLHPIQGVHMLNGVPLTSKFSDAVKLREAGVPTVEVSERRPEVRNAPPPPPPTFAVPAQTLTQAEARAMMERLTDFVNTRPPAPPPPITWLPRRTNHVGGTDLLTPPQTPGYYSKKEDLVREFRVHAFGGRSIRAGVKVAREGWGVGAGLRPLHPWVRSFDGGWRIQYDGFVSTDQMRELAFATLKALGLNFGAIDIGERADGSLIVLECNRAPGLEGGTVRAYAEAIQRWEAKAEGTRPQVRNR